MTELTDQAPRLAVGMITVDCADPATLVPFWTSVLDVGVAADFEGEFVMLEQDPRGIRLAFQRVPEPRTGKNTVHVDLGTDDRDREVERVLALGATKVAEQEMPGLVWTVLADPEGNQFCIGAEH